MSYPATEENLRLGAGREIRRLKDENAALKIAQARYECVRRLNVRQFTDLYRANIRGDGAFDDLVDQLIRGDMCAA